MAGCNAAPHAHLVLALRPSVSQYVFILALLDSAARGLPASSTSKHMLTRNTRGLGGLLPPSFHHPRYLLLWSGKPSPWSFLASYSLMCHNRCLSCSITFETSSGSPPCPAFSQRQQFLVKCMVHVHSWRILCGLHQYVVAMVPARPRKALCGLLCLLGACCAHAHRKPCVGFNQCWVGAWCAHSKKPCVGFSQCLVGAWCAHTPRKPCVGSIGQAEHVIAANIMV